MLLLATSTAVKAVGCCVAANGLCCCQGSEAAVLLLATSAAVKAVSCCVAANGLCCCQGSEAVSTVFVLSCCNNDNAAVCL